MEPHAIYCIHTVRAFAIARRTMSRAGNHVVTYRNTVSVNSTAVSSIARLKLAFTSSSEGASFQEGLSLPTRDANPVEILQGRFTQQVQQAQ